VLFLVHRFLSLWWRRRQVPPKRRFLQEPHGVTTQKTPFFRYVHDHDVYHFSSYVKTPQFCWLEVLASVTFVTVNIIHLGVMNAFICWLPQGLMCSWVRCLLRNTESLRSARCYITAVFYTNFWRIWSEPKGDGNFEPFRLHPQPFEVSSFRSIGCL
jgi:hypothetical protein